MFGFLKKIWGGAPSVNYKELVANGAIIVDVRSKAEYDQGHIPGSKNIPLQSIASKLSSLNKEKTVITCCASGMRSASAKAILKSAGFKEVHNGGGWFSLYRKISND